MQANLSLRPPLSRGAVLMLLIALVLIWFVPLGMRHLIPTDEGRYAEMAREMFVTGDWITPRYNGYKYFEKPPLQTWANALTFALFGIGEWQARFYTALTGFAGIVVVGYTGARLFGALAGWSAAVVMVATPYWYLMGHFNALDMGLSFWMTVTLCALLLAQRDTLTRAGRRGWMWLSWGGMAMAMLSKGLIGIMIPGAVLIVYMVVARDWRIFLRIHLPSGLLVFVIICAPWFYLVQRDNPEFFHFFFVVQQFQRYLTPEQNRPGPLYYFVPVLMVGMLPWLTLLPASVRDVFRAPREANRFSPTLMLLVWAVFIFAFFSASHSKLPSYVLPVAPALALLLGRVLPTLSPRGWRRHMIFYVVVLVIGLVAAGVYLRTMGSDDTPNALYVAYTNWVWVAIGCGLVGTIGAWLLSRRSMTASVLSFVAGWCVLVTVAGTGHEVFGRLRSGVLLAPAVKAALASLPADTPFYSVHKLDHTFPFYIGHTMIMVRDADELAFGVAQEPSKWVPTDAAFTARWYHDAHALALMPPDVYASFKAAHLPMKVIAQDPWRVIVEK
ncbi:4-amino-4-deoxy-L-arabinose transferase [Robbsia andropogonis]|uniref:4-amino-4-deoxy-L-arabinose transferase n=2 Tax=Robbsia andropogonis TaxID=28092 RepID=A0A0F5JWZ1_9BURK|nr:glycosyltransferase family 39 protein [Robbsia andropogonis]KKB62139.1 4-amino-4-deoxy-L-arabinose transferase [Robbsia andropogonis]MCP1119574.1 glycosyltransferase family 39 protein [Robbsia andropogonis]MCP1129557.1 glycosyltransferase family 39 protein [Robbsia andropogonis]